MTISLTCFITKDLDFERFIYTPKKQAVSLIPGYGKVMD